MSNEQAELLARTTYRRMLRNKRTRAVAIAKVISMWLFAFTANIWLIFVMYDIVPDRPVLRWFLIIIFTYAWVWFFDDMTEKIAIKSPQGAAIPEGDRDKKSL